MIDRTEAAASFMRDGGTEGRKRAESVRGGARSFGELVHVVQRWEGPVHEATDLVPYAAFMHGNLNSWSTNPSIRIAFLEKLPLA